VFDHVTVRVADRGASRRFYETVLAPLGHVLTSSGGHYDERARGDGPNVPGRVGPPLRQYLPRSHLKEEGTEALVAPKETHFMAP